MKAVPGRKTDIKDAEWLAELLQHGLLKPSFIPDRESRERRELVRYRRSLVEQRAHLVQRIQKLLEGANIKLGDVASDMMGVSGRAMLQALTEGVDDPAAVASMAKTALRNKIPELERALTGSVGHHQRFLLRSQFRLLESIEAEIATLDDEVAERLRPFQVALDRLDEIPGIGRRAAEQHQHRRPGIGAGVGHHAKGQRGIERNMRGEPAWSGIQRRSKQLECRHMRHFSAKRETNNGNPIGVDPEFARQAAQRGVSVRHAGQQIAR